MSQLVSHIATLSVRTEVLNAVEAAITGLSTAELQWLSGYLAGRAGPSPATEDSPAPAITILYGSQTGNGRRVAEALAERAAARGLASTVLNMADYTASRLKRERCLAVVVSTHGEGDPPDDAAELHALLGGRRRPDLSGLQFGVLALGDSSYEHFCQTGRDFDERLAAAGATRLTDLAECDVDYETVVDEWQDSLLDRAEEVQGGSGRTNAPALRAVPTSPRWDRRNPFPAELLLNQRITGRGSSKDVRHIELSLEGAGLVYQPGDSLGVVNRNPACVVDPLMEALGLDDAAARARLLDELEVTTVNRRFLESWAQREPSGKLADLLGSASAAELGAWMRVRQILDVVVEYPGDVESMDLGDLLRPLTPRLYSIASAPAFAEDEVHLTVGLVHYQYAEREHWGASSGWLALDRADGDTVGVYVEPNNRFRLPGDPDRDIVMIGPGTGVAPFRAFMQARELAGGTGRNWLFFGDRNFRTDFLYQSEWLRWRRQGLLHELDVAFSRDQADKRYVQHRMLERSAALHAWIAGGASVYVCGDASRMAPDVEQALLAILRNHEQLDEEAAAERLAELRRAGRYQRDVY